MKILSFVLVLLTCALSAVGVSAQDVKKQELLAQTAPKTDNPKTPARNYIIGTGDELRITVWNEPQFNGEYTVNEEGKIVLAFVNKTIQAACRTQAEVTADITAAFTKYLKNPTPNVSIKKNITPSVVYGEVRMPQKIEMQRQVRLLELLSFSGGWTEKAGGTVQVFHTQPLQCPEQGEAEAQPQQLTDGSNVPFQVYKLSELSSGKNETNPIIRPGDVVNVQKAPPVFIIGEVRNPPAPDSLTIPENGLMLTDAIARSGGLAIGAKKKDVRIYRRKPGLKEPEILSANLEDIKKKKQPDIALQPYDVVEVEKAPKSITDYLKESMQLVINTASATLPYRVMY